jgi:NCAIR mutase (PurE)-related protein
MDERRLRKLLDRYRAGRLSQDGLLRALRKLPFEDLGFARVDHHRALRDGVGEVIFCEGKTPRQIEGIARSMLRSTGRLLATRADPAAAAAIRRVRRSARVHSEARCVTVGRAPRRPGRIVILTAGTADLPVAHEARVSAEYAGCETRLICDAGVAGLHRLLGHLAELREAAALIVVAGMEGALASVVGGLAGRPVIAVPTSVGYGAGFRGLAPLLTMINSCAPGVSVVNIDNGFGAAMVAAMISGGV